MSESIKKPQSELLFEEYRKARNVDITLSQFIYIMNLYPSLLVCMSDGVLDKEEWDGVLNIAKGLAMAYAEASEQEKMERVFRTEFKYLLDNIEKWQKKFLNALKNHIEGSKEDKEFVLEAMYLFANIADGISSEEQEKIEALSERLSLAY